MRDLINKVCLEESMELRELREEWYVLAWNGEGWNWSDAMTKPVAEADYARQIRFMPNCPAKLIRVNTMAEESGTTAEALRVPVR